jgi:hypothetical protein
MCTGAGVYGNMWCIAAPNAQSNNTRGLLQRVVQLVLHMQF